jgi:hypothetical protein
MKRSARLLVVAILIATAALVAFAGPAAAKGPPPVATNISLNCPSGVHSYMTNIGLFDKNGFEIIPTGLAQLECGTSTVGTQQGFNQSLSFSSGTKPAFYCFSQWVWDGSAAGGVDGTCFGFGIPVSKGGKGTVVSATSVGGPAGLTFEIH